MTILDWLNKDKYNKIVDGLSKIYVDLYHHNIWISDDEKHNFPALHSRFVCFYDGQEHGEIRKLGSTVLVSVWKVKDKKTGYWGSLLRIRDKAWKDITPGTISHEAYHITCNIFKSVGSDPSEVEEETFAYLLGWVVDKIQDEHNKRINR